MLCGVLWTLMRKSCAKSCAKVLCARDAQRASKLAVFVAHDFFQIARFQCICLIRPPEGHMRGLMQGLCRVVCGLMRIKMGKKCYALSCSTAPQQVLCKALYEVFWQNLVRHNNLIENRRLMCHKTLHKIVTC